jgi:MFS family permease
MRNNRLVFAILSMGLISFLGIVVETALNLVFPFFMSSYNITSDTVQWLTSGYMLVSTIIIPFGAFLRKRFKIKTLFRIGTTSFLVGTILAIVANNFEVLLVGRLIQGIANGIVLPLMFSIIIKQASPKHLGTFMGMGSLVLAFAPAVGPVYGGVISKLLNWKYIFIFLIPIILFAWILGEKSIK